MAALNGLWPDWPAPWEVQAVSTVRRGGVSRPPYCSLNLAEHVGDDPQAVAENRQRLVQGLELPSPPFWLAQAHSAQVVEAGGTSCKADAAYTARPGIVCAVLTADCLPLLLYAGSQQRVAAVHVGWRGLTAGVIEAALEALGGHESGTLAWLGPAIGPSAFEVDGRVRDLCLAEDPKAWGAFRPSGLGRWRADLYELARRRLARWGVTRIYGGGWCTYRESERFFSYRREGVTGRMATLIWIRN